MAKFYGAIGYADQVDTGHGVWGEQITERNYYGDVVKNTKRFEKGEHLNDDLNVSNTISIIADAYAEQHFFAIRYVSWMGAKWKVTNVDVQRPRLVLSLGGVYNGPEN